MKDTQDAMRKYVNQDCLEPPLFHVRDCTYVHTNHIRTNRTLHKLAEKKIGPFSIIAQPSTMSFTLCLPSTICIHPVFHVSQLEPKFPNTFNNHNQPPPPPLIVNGNPEYLIKRIINLKYNQMRRHCQLSYHIKWISYPISNNPSDWILADAFDDNASKSLADVYHTQHPDKPSPEKLTKDWEKQIN